MQGLAVASLLRVLACINAWHSPWGSLVCLIILVALPLWQNLVTVVEPLTMDSKIQSGCLYTVKYVILQGLFPRQSPLSAIFCEVSILRINFLNFKFKYWDDQFSRGIYFCEFGLLAKFAKLNTVQNKVPWKYSRGRGSYWEPLDFTKL